MTKAEGNYKAHVFVCTNQKAKGSCCAPHGAEDLRQTLKQWAAEKPEWRGKIRINASGCLDRCEHGVAIAIYPQNEWIIDARTANLADIKNQIESLMAQPD